jgi:hypothetical protein
VQTFIVTHHTRVKIIESGDNCKKNNSRKERHFIGEYRKGRMDGSFKPGDFIFVIHNTLCLFEIGKLILQSACSDKFARNIFLISYKTYDPPGVEVVGPTKGVNVIVSVDGWMVPVGVDVQIGISKSIFAWIDSVLKLLMSMILSFATENWKAMLSNVSFSWT